MRGVAAQPRETTADNAHCANQQVYQPSYPAPAQGFGPNGELDTSGVQRIRWDAATATEPLAAWDCPEASPVPELLSASLLVAASSTQPTLRGFP